MRNPASEDGNGRPRGRGLKPAARIVVGLLLAAVAGFVALSWSSVSAIRSHPGFAGFSTTSTGLIHAELGGRNYAIPANYIDSGPSEVNGRKTILLETLWPSLEGRTEENYDRFRVGHPGQIIRILLETYDHLPVTAADGVRIMLNIKKDSSAPLEARAPVDGLERLVPIDRGRRISRFELFIERKDGQVTSFLACWPDGSVPYPSCSHWFALNDEIRANVTYGKPYFPSWRQIRARVTALLAGFETDEAGAAGSEYELTPRRGHPVMADALTAADFAELYTFVQIGDTIGYYEYLAGKGYDYGRLAAGLVQNDRGNGQIARVFVTAVAADEALSLPGPNERKWRSRRLPRRRLCLRRS